METMLGNIKVKHPSLKKAVYLELAKAVKKGSKTFITGYECTSQCEPIGKDLTLHVIEYGDGVKITKRECDKHYGEFHDAGEIKP